VTRKAVSRRAFLGTAGALAATTSIASIAAVEATATRGGSVTHLRRRPMAADTAA
jgi:hypothetical protein